MFKEGKTWKCTVYKGNRTKWFLPLFSAHFDRVISFHLFFNIHAHFLPLYGFSPLTVSSGNDMHNIQIRRPSDTASTISALTFNSFSTLTHTLHYPPGCKKALCWQKLLFTYGQSGEAILSKRAPSLFPPPPFPHNVFQKKNGQKWQFLRRCIIFDLYFLPDLMGS